MLADHRLQPFASVTAKNRPELEGAEAAAERDRVFAQVGDVVIRAQELRDEAERAA